MEPVPPTMRALVAPFECTPKDYAIHEVPTPRITRPTQVLLRVHAFTFTPGEFRVAAGWMKLIYKPTYPLQLGMEGAGEVVAVGSDVTAFKIGDAAYGNAFERPAFRGPPPGLASEYAVVDERLLLPKPPHLSFADVAPLTGVTVTAVQAFRRGMALAGLESVQGRTVFVGGGLSATGSVGAQYAKNALGAGRLVSTLSTAKMALVDELLPGVVDEKVDYVRTRVSGAVAPRSVDLAYHTQSTAPLRETIAVTRGGGAVVDIAGIPDRQLVRDVLGTDRLPWWLLLALEVLQLRRWWLLLGTGVGYAMISGAPDVREDLERAGEVVASGQVKAVPTTVDFDDLGAVRTVCGTAYKGKGGVGQIVVRIR
ncbi:GroES-like protein [Cordyceps fumosorosea ARSEF 2679]|uniref:GroES-like protein n=1 Tax=Cordyceps fumosorosea (strain ARSEF 2679) TaxID=1081104 RepID=A0A162J116_CORFA|nr:GroES-like protein [Cordyceps fumosorosea ARSEF 2679]OAA62222.1 GroES-like protein [Cordyceps fumosorosea ARSEF 2679]